MRNHVHDNWVYGQAVDHERCRIVRTPNVYPSLPDGFPPRPVIG